MAKGENYIVVLDIGSATVRILVAHLIPDEKPRIIGVGVAPAGGMRRGVIVDFEEVATSIQKAIEEAELSSGIKIEAVYASVGGAGLRCLPVKGVIAVGRADGEVAEEDVERAIESAQNVNISANEEILHVIPQSFQLDDQYDIKDPVGMSGVRLEMQGLMIVGSAPQLKNIAKCLEGIGLEVEGFVASPLAAAKAVLSKRQKELGVAVVDIGGGTTSLAVYEERKLLYVGVIPVGASHITNDVAIGLRTSVDVAEKIKLKYGSALPGEINKKEQINLSDIDPQEEGVVSRKHVAEIMEARVEEIFYLAEKELKKIERSALLPAGVVLVGGGACTQGTVDLAKNILSLPAQTGFPIELGGLVDKVDNPAFAVSIGMILWIIEDPAIMAQNSGSGGFGSSLSNLFAKKDFSARLGSLKAVGEKTRKLMRKFLP